MYTTVNGVIQSTCVLLILLWRTLVHNTAASIDVDSMPNFFSVFCWKNGNLEIKLPHLHRLMMKDRKIVTEDKYG